MAASALPRIEQSTADSMPAAAVAWQHSGRSGQFAVRVDLVRGAGRRGAVPEVVLGYESGAGNGVFGLGWSLSLPAIVRGNGRQLPRYRDSGPEADPYSSTEFGELVPCLHQVEGGWQPEPGAADGFQVVRFRPRIEAAFARIERRLDLSTGEIHWVITSADNVTRVFGRTAAARIADPDNPNRVATWLLEEQSDSLGNQVRYEYKREDLAGVTPDSVWENRRFETARSEAAVHPKRIRWGNARPHEAGGWFFELVFDYGEHDAADPRPTERQPWLLRPDSYSSCRNGFEVRTRRICRRVLFFQNIGESPHLVRAHELGYQSSPATSLLTAVTLRGYRRESSGAISSQSLPTTRFHYSPNLGPGPIRELSCLDGIAGLGRVAAEQQWLDLDGTALPGLLCRESKGTLYYRSNLGDGRLGRPTLLSTRPALTDSGSATAQGLSQPFGDSRSCLVDLTVGPGYQERAKGGEWLPYRPFRGTPTAVAHPAGSRSLDLDGDGRADLLLSGESGVRWHSFKGREGWSPSRQSRPSPSANAALADQTGTVLLADMNGDGLADLVQVRPGSVRYWPNLGYGRFGEAVPMAGSPMLDGPDAFDPARVRLVDITGSGAADLLYLGRDAPTWYPNRNGNSFGPAEDIGDLPTVTDLDSIDVVDLFGTGTGCLVWSSASPRHVDRSVRYVELVGGQRSDILTRLDNGQGLQIDITYAPATRLMLRDRAAGRPWHSTLPSAEWLVTEVRETDLVSGVGRISRWSYRHGFYDDVAREARGFAFIEREDTQVLPDDPVEARLSPRIPERVTRTWYHTGAFLERASLDGLVAAEFFAGDPAGPARPGLAVDNEVGITPRELLRALQGQPIREEVYGAEGGETDRCPYTVVDYGYLIRGLQPNAPNQPPAVAAFTREVVEYTYERNPNDPRVSHQIILAVDSFGTPTRLARVAYPRRHPQEPEQSKTLVVVEERRVAHRADALDGYRIGVPVAESSYELGPVPPVRTGALYHAEQIDGWIATAALEDVPFEQALPDRGPPRRRLLKASESYYWDDRLIDTAALGVVGQWALVHHTRRAAFTPGLLAATYDAEAASAARLVELGYEFQRGLWWARQSQLTYDPASFYQPIAERTPRGGDYSISYDALRLFVTEMRDPVGNVERADYDYQALAPARITDPNGANILAAFDALGLPIAVALAGARGEGDSLASPTTVVARDLLAWERERRPVALRISTRTRHADPATPWEARVSYLDGRSRSIQERQLAESASGDAGERWVVTRHEVATAEGRTVRSLAAGFSAHDRFGPGSELAALPVTRMRLDALGRVLEERRPDGALNRSATTAWRTIRSDPNDVVRDSDWWSVRRRPGATPAEAAEADAAERHQGTSAVEHLDPLGRAFLESQDGGSALGLASTRTELGIDGETRAVMDPRGIETERRFCDMLGRALQVRSTASGVTRVLHDAEGQPAYAWGARGQEQRIHRDDLGRVVRRDLRPHRGEWRVAERLVWGERAASPEGYLRGRLHLHYDGAGQSKIAGCDFHGNPLRTERRFRSDLTSPADWSSLNRFERADSIEREAARLLASESFVTTATYDVQERPVSRTTPDGSTTHIDYGPRGLPLEIRVLVDGSATRVLHSPAYDAAGRRTSAFLGNGVREISEFDEGSGFLTRLATLGRDGIALRDLHLRHDAVGNVLAISDAGQQTLYFSNAVVSPDRTFRYDSLYRLIEATGREVAEPPAPLDRASAPPLRPVPHANDLNAVRAYTERYRYDRAGNLLKMEHVAPSDGSWTVRHDISETSDRITGLRDAHDLRLPSRFAYDAAGNATELGGFTGLSWNDDEQLARVDLGGGGTAYYLYDAMGERAAKIIARLGGSREERFYVDGCEYYRRVNGPGETTEEGTTLHVPDGQARLLLVERRRVAGDAAWFNRWRYQHSDQVGSCSVETGEDGGVLSFEEFRPYGQTAYHAAASTLPPKRYRFGGLENDSETGLNYHHARYYVTWLGRWLSPDPAGMRDGTNCYWFARGSPLVHSDPTGNQSEPEEELQRWRRSRVQSPFGSSEYEAGVDSMLAQRFPSRGQEFLTFQDALVPRVHRPASSPRSHRSHHGADHQPHRGEATEARSSATPPPSAASPVESPPSSQVIPNAVTAPADHQAEPGRSIPEQIARGVFNSAWQHVIKPSFEFFATASPGAAALLTPILGNPVENGISLYRGLAHSVGGLVTSIRERGVLGTASHLVTNSTVVQEAQRMWAADARGDIQGTIEHGYSAAVAAVNIVMAMRGLPGTARTVARSVPVLARRARIEMRFRLANALDELDPASAVAGRSGQWGAPCSDSLGSSPRSATRQVAQRVEIEVSQAASDYRGVGERPNFNRPASSSQALSPNINPNAAHGNSGTLSFATQSVPSPPPFQLLEELVSAYPSRRRYAPGDLYMPGVNIRRRRHIYWEQEEMSVPVAREHAVRSGECIVLMPSHHHIILVRADGSVFDIFMRAPRGRAHLPGLDLTGPARVPLDWAVMLTEGLIWIRRRH